MRYHTTLKDIAVSILVLISCAILCLYGMATLGMGNPSQYIADRILQTFAGGGPVTFKAESIDRMFLKDLVINKPSFSLTEHTTAAADSIQVQGGLPSLFSSYVFGSQQVSAIVNNPKLEINESLQDISLGGTSSSKGLQQWLTSNTFHIKAVGAQASLNTADVKAEIADASLDLLFDSNAQFPLIRGTVPAFDLKTNLFQATVLDSEIGLDETGNALLQSNTATLRQKDLKFSFSQFIALGQLTSLSVADAELTISLSLANLQANSEQFTASIPKLTSEVSISKGAFDFATLSYDQLTLDYDQFSILSPTATITGKKDQDRLLLGLATKEGDFFKVSYASDLSLQLQTVQANAQYTGQQASVQVSLGQVRYSIEGLQASLDTAYLETQAKLDGADLVEIDMILRSDAQVVIPEKDLVFVSPLSATLKYRTSDASLSTSASLSMLSSSFTTKPLSARLSFQSNIHGSQLQAELDYEDSLSIQSVYDMPASADGTFFVTSRFANFPLSILSPTFEAYVPFIKPYYQASTNLIGNLSFQSSSGGGSILPFDGKAAIELALLSAKVGKIELDAGFTFLADIEGDSVFVDAMTLASSGYRLAFTGSTELNYWLPRGELDLFSIDDGQRLLSINFFDQPPANYRFRVTTPFEPSLLVDGTISKEGVESIVGKADFSLFNTTYPFDFHLNTSNLQFSLTQEEHLSLRASLAPPIKANLQTKELRLPDAGFFSLASISGILEAEYFSLRDWHLDSEQIKIEGVRFQNRSYDLTTSVGASENRISFPNMQLSEGEHVFPSQFSYSGTDFVSLIQSSFLAPFEATFSLDANQERKISISLLGESNRIRAAAQVNSLPLDRFAPGLEGTIVDFSALGYSDFKQDASLDGLVSLRRGNASLTAKLGLDQTSIRLYDASLLFPDFTYTGQLLQIQNQAARSSGTIEHIRHLDYKDQLSTVTYDLFIDLGSMQTIFSLPKAIKPLLGGNVKATLSLSDILVLGEGGFSSGTHQLSLSAGMINVDGDHLDLSYEIDSKHLQATMNPSFGIGFSAEGSLASSDFGLSIQNIHLPLSLLNRTFLKPVFSFIDGIGEGELYLAKTAEGLRSYGQLWVNSARMQVFWLAQDIITMKNASVTVDGSRAITSRVPFFSTNTITGKTIEGYGWLGASFDGLRLENYEIHAESGDQKVYLWIPIQGFDADVKTYAGGTFNLFGVGFETWLDGKVTIQDTAMTLGIRDLPSWYIANNLTTTNFEVVTGKNVSFFYPNTPNPFIRATITENQKISFVYDHITDEFVADGNLSFRSGEIYYFQKNFFITEGSLAIHTDALTGRNQIQPTINLRAKMTDFDTQGNRVDIFLVLRDSGLSNLNPQFESIPAKDVNEIFEILGQSILPTGAYGEVNLYSVASLAAAATDVAERLGYIDASQTTALTESIRISLGLDMFSIRSNILQNIIFDALPGSNLGGTLTPLARYLNNTSIFMGKYVGRQFFLQALVHLSAMDRSKVKRSFISPDLSLDLELSLDWLNPLGTFSFFTQPDELSFTNILDTIGFSVTKRIVLR